jgi:hypothetical protein
MPEQSTHAFELPDALRKVELFMSTVDADRMHTDPVYYFTSLTTFVERFDEWLRTDKDCVSSDATRSAIAFFWGEIRNFISDADTIHRFGSPEAKAAAEKFAKTANAAIGDYVRALKAFDTALDATKTCDARKVMM